MLRNRMFFVMGLLVVASMILTAWGAATPAAPAATEAPAVAPATQAPEVIPTEAPITATSYTTPHPILGDLKVRQALSYCTNKADLIKLSFA